MAAGSSSGDDNFSKNSGASPSPLMEKTTATKRLRFTTQTQQTQQPALKSSSLPCTPLYVSLDTIPIDLIAEILVRLPVKFLLRLRCVCKSWNALISNLQFAKKQFQALAMDPTHLTRHRLILNTPSESLLKDYSLPSVFNNLITSATQRKCPYSNEKKNFHFLAGSCHGMLFLATGQSGAFLWNPSTGKFKTLPSLKTQRRSHGGSNSSTVYGFGYDHFSDNYKVVALFMYRRNTGGGNFVYETDVMVHTLGTNSWRAIQDFPTRIPSHSGQFVSGTLNWVAKDEKSSSSWVIVSLDLGMETYQQLLPPDCGGGDKVTLTPGVLKGCLSIFSDFNMAMDVWLMKDYGNKESWTKLFSVPYIGRHPQYDPYYTRALCISDEDDKILLEFESKLIVYNSRNDIFTTAAIQNFRGCIAAQTYVESLISPY